MDASIPVVQLAPKYGQPNQKRNVRRKQPQHSGDIVFSKGTSFHTMPSLSKQLKGATECVIGLQFIWEYRSPSKSVPTHYQCKLCCVCRLQHDMLAHVKGWKHSFRYLKKTHPDKVSYEEGEAIKDPAVRKAIKEIAYEVEKTEGRGQLKVILKEPCEVPAFNGLLSAVPRIKYQPPRQPGMGAAFGPRLSDPKFPGDFHPQGAPLPVYPMGSMAKTGFGGYSSLQEFRDSGMDQGPFPDNMGDHSTGDTFGRGGERDCYGGGQGDGLSGRMYPIGFRDGLMDQQPGRPGLMGMAPESSSLPNTLLTYLDSFRIENETDAQLVLKVTQKLTDVLMEYRLRSVSPGTGLNSFSMSSTSYSSSRLPSKTGRYSSSLSGPSRYSDAQPRFYK